MKRKLALFLTLAMLFSLCPANVLTAAAEELSFRLTADAKDASKMMQGDQYPYFLECISGDVTAAATPSILWKTSDAKILDIQEDKDVYKSEVVREWDQKAPYDENDYKIGIRAKEGGTATLTAEFRSDGRKIKEASIEITVSGLYAIACRGKRDSAEIAQERVTLNIEQGNPDDITGVTWKTGDTSVLKFIDDSGIKEAAEVTGGKNIDIKGLKQGKASVSAEITYSQRGKENTVTRTIEITVKDGGGSGPEFRFVDRGETVNERTIKPKEGTVLNVEKNGGREDPARYKLEIVDFGEGERPISLKNGQQETGVLEITGWPDDRHVEIVAGERNGDATVVMTAFDGSGQKVGEGHVRIHVNGGSEEPLPYEGPVDMFYSTDLDIEMEGWNEALQAKYGDPFTVQAEGEGDDAVVNIVMNLTDEAWKEVYKNADVSDDINVRLSYPVPREGLAGYMYFDSADEELTEDLVRNVLHHGQMNFNDDGSLRTKVGLKIGQIVYTGGKTVINAVDLPEDTMVGVYYTKLSPKELYTWEGKGNVRLTKFKVTQKQGERSIPVTSGGGLRAEWFSYDTEKTLTEDELKGIELKDKKVSYLFDGDQMIREKEEQFRGKNVVTILSIPGAEEVNVTPMNVQLKGSQVDTGDPANVRFIMPVLIGPDTFGNERPNSYLVKYKVDGVWYQDVLYFNLKFNFKQPLHIYFEKPFTPVEESRVSFDSTLTDGENRGFELKYVADGQFASYWTGADVDTEGLVPEFSVSAPEGKNVTGYRMFYGTPGETVKGAEEVVRINLEGSELHEGSGPIRFDFEYAPEEHTVEDATFYSLRRSQHGDERVYEILWYCEGGEEIREFLFFSLEKDSHVNMPAEVHQEIGNPEPELIEVTDADGNPVDITGWELETGYYARGKRKGNKDYDYYTIDLKDAHGNYFDKDGSKVKIRFTYPRGVSYDDLSKYNFVLNHYMDEFYHNKEQETLSFGMDGIYVTLSRFSPFMITWEKETEPEPEPEPISGGGSGSGSGSTAVVKPDKAVTPITVAADGKQMMGSSVVSLVAAKLTAAEKASYVENAFWFKDARGYWYLKGADNKLFTNCWALVSDRLSRNSIGNASWFYLDEKGRMLTGWHWIMGADGRRRCYYFNKEDGSLYGACLLGGMTPDGYVLNERGEWTDPAGNVQTK